MRRLSVFLLLVCLVQAALAQEVKPEEVGSPKMNGEQPASALPLPRPLPEAKPWEKPLELSVKGLPAMADTAAHRRLQHAWKDEQALSLAPFGMPVLPYAVPPGSYDFSQTGEIAHARGFDFYGASGWREYPGLLTVQSASVGFGRSFGALHLRMGATAARYRALHVATQYGVQGQLSYQLTDRLSATLFGQYYNAQPYFSMAAFPFVATSRYGGYLTWIGQGFGVDVGAERYYDAFGRRWITSPILTPKFNISRKVKVELPLGGLVRTVVEKAVYGKRSRGSIILPPGY